MPLKRNRLTAPETLPPRPVPKVAEALPILDCEAEFIDLITAFPRIGAVFRVEEFRNVWVRPLRDRHWIVNEYPMFLSASFNYVKQQRVYSGPSLCSVRGLIVSARVTQQPRHPLFASIESNTNTERLIQVAAFVQLLVRDRWTPHVEYYEQAGNP
jgi:hypothetical protein